MNNWKMFLTGKYNLLCTLLLLLCPLTVLSSAQASSFVNQTELANDGAFARYIIAYDKGSKSYAITGCCNDTWQISSESYRDNFKRIFLAKSETKNSEYYPDEEAYPVTYVRGHNGYATASSGSSAGKLHQKYGFDAGLRISPKDRMVFIGEWVYVLENWKSKDSYRIAYIAKKGAIKGMKKMVESTKAAMKGKTEGPRHKEILQAYLDEGFKLQEAALPAWTAANKTALAERERVQKAFDDELNSDNAKEMAKQMMTVKNTGSTTLHFLTQTNRGSDFKNVSIGPDRQRTIHCGTDIFRNTEITPALWVNGKTHCGKTVELAP